MTESREIATFLSLSWQNLLHALAYVSENSNAKNWGKRKNGSMIRSVWGISSLCVCTFLFAVVSFPFSTSQQIDNNDQHKTDKDKWQIWKKQQQQQQLMSQQIQNHSPQGIYGMKWNRSVHSIFFPSPPFNQIRFLFVTHIPFSSYMAYIEFGAVDIDFLVCYVYVYNLATIFPFSFYCTSFVGVFSLFRFLFFLFLWCARNHIPPDGYALVTLSYLFISLINEFVVVVGP